MRPRCETISQEAKDLKLLERRYRDKPQEIRLKTLRLLKENPSLTLGEAAQILGRSERTLQRWCQTYRLQGLEGVLKVGQKGGRRPTRIGEVGLRELEHKLRENSFCDLKDVQGFLKERFGVSYSLTGVWYLVRMKLKASLKNHRARS